jgi:hypothetical protein
MIDYGVRVKLNDMLNKNPDAVIDLCLEQGEVWRTQRAATITDGR